jgi:hypothetical protein
MANKKENASKGLGITDNAVRQHITALKRNGMVAGGETQSTGGRPERLYGLTAAGQELDYLESRRPIVCFTISPSDTPKSVTSPRSHSRPSAAIEGSRCEGEGIPSGCDRGDDEYPPR